MRLLDLFCGAGGAAAGYAAAGFDVVGVDIHPQPHYPYEFYQGDALAFLALHGYEFDAIHASPPCQRFSKLQVIRKRDYADLVTPTRDRLVSAGVPYVMENVVGAPLITPTMLCGTMFGLQIPGGYLKRHRLFEAGPDPWLPILTPPCQHPAGVRAVGVYGHTGGHAIRSGNHMWRVAQWREVMGIDWMSRDELAQAIPPAYTEYVGTFLRERIGGSHVV